MQETRIPIPIHGDPLGTLIGATAAQRQQTPLNDFLTFPSTNDAILDGAREGPLSAKLT